MRTLPIIFGLLISLRAAFAQQAPKSPVPNSWSDGEAVEIPTGCVKIHGMFFRAASGGVHSTAIYLHGRPGFTGDLDLPVPLSGAGGKFKPPLVETTKAARSGGGVKLEATLRSMGDSKSLDVSFEYRSPEGLDTNERSGAWQSTPIQKMMAEGDFSAMAGTWEAQVPYEFRAVVKHPVLTMYGDSKKSRFREK